MCPRTRVLVIARSGGVALWLPLAVRRARLAAFVPVHGVRVTEQEEKGPSFVGEVLMARRKTRR